MDIFIILKKSKDGKTCAVSAFTVLDIAMKFAKNLKKIDAESEYTVVSSLLFDTI